VDFDFSTGDSVKICMTFQTKDLFEGMFQLVQYPTEFYVSTGPLGAGDTATCIPRIGQLTQVGVTESLAASFAGFGACDFSEFSISESRRLGAAAFDEFQYEIRPLGIPKEITFTKPSEFPYRPAMRK